jgi:hypothetical protein
MDSPTFSPTPLDRLKFGSRRGLQITGSIAFLTSTPTHGVNHSAGGTPSSLPIFNMPERTPPDTGSTELGADKHRHNRSRTTLSSGSVTQATTDTRLPAAAGLPGPLTDHTSLAMAGSGRNAGSDVGPAKGATRTHAAARRGAGSRSARGLVRRSKRPIKPVIHDEIHSDDPLLLTGPWKDED